MSTSRIIPQSVGIFKCLILCHGVRARSRACVCASAPREWICMYPRVQDLKDSPSGDSCRLTPALHLPSLTFPISKPFFQPSLSFVSYFPLFFFIEFLYIYFFSSVWFSPSSLQVFCNYQTRRWQRSPCRIAPPHNRAKTGHVGQEKDQKKK